MDKQEIKNKIDEMFNDNSINHQSHMVVGMFKLFIPNFDNIVKIEGYPQVGEKLSKYIWDKMQKFDEKHHPDCIVGGAWLNYGFGTNKNLNPWEFSLGNCKIIN